jgi:hypothetical protein
MLRHIATDPLRGLVHSDVHADEFDFVAIQLVGGLEAGKQGFAVLTPGGPELQHYRLFPQPLSEVYRLAVEIVDRDHRGFASQFDAGFSLRQKWRRGANRKQNCCDEPSIDQETFPI